MKKIIIKVIILIALSQSAWTQGQPIRQVEVDVHAPARPVGSIINSSEAGFAGLYYQAGTVVDGWTGYVGDSLWIDTSTFQIGSSSKPIHLLLSNQRAMIIDTALIALSRALQVDGAHDVLFGASATGAGDKSLWIAEKGALRAGSINGTQWDVSNIGQNSVAFGRDTRATNDEALAFGLGSDASGKQSVAFGAATDATADQSTAFGFQSAASGLRATSWGVNTRARGLNSTAWGNMSIAAGEESTAWGEGNIAQSKYETVIGSYADTLSSANATSATSTDHLFVVGNGTTDVSRHNALTIYKNGNTKVGGALTLDNHLVTVTAPSATIDIGEKSFISLDNTNEAAIVDITLGNGAFSGQILILTSTGVDCQLTDGNNVELASSTRDIFTEDTIQLLWDGSDWLEIAYSNN